MSKETTEEMKQKEPATPSEGARTVALDAALLGFGVLLMTMIFGGLAAAALVLLARGAEQVMCFGIVHGLICGLAMALILQAVFIGGLAPVVRRVSLLLLAWGLTLTPLCWMAYEETQRPDYDLALNLFLFPKTRVTAQVVGVLLLLELLLWVGLIVYRRYRRSRRSA